MIKLFELPVSIRKCFSTQLTFTRIKALNKIPGRVADMLAKKTTNAEVGALLVLLVNLGIYIL